MLANFEEKTRRPKCKVAAPHETQQEVATTTAALEHRTNVWALGGARTKPKKTKPKKPSKREEMAVKLKARCARTHLKEDVNTYSLNLTFFTTPILFEAKDFFQRDSRLNIEPPQSRRQFIEEIGKPMRRNFELLGKCNLACLLVYLFTCLLVYLFVCLCICLPVCLFFASLCICCLIVYLIDCFLSCLLPAFFLICLLACFLSCLFVC